MCAVYDVFYLHVH